ncbi:hypothetical protein [Deinococcus sp. PESE-13]
MQFEMLRAHQRFLPLIGHRQRRRFDEEPPRADVDIVVSREAEFVLRNALSTSSQHSGPLFGRQTGRTLTLAYAATRGYRASDDPLSLDPQYLLGLSDAYHQVTGGLDWVGHWVVAEGGGLPSPRAALSWYEVALQRHLVTTQYPLVLAGWRDSRLSLLACTVGENEDCQWVPAHFVSTPEEPHVQ